MLVVLVRQQRVAGPEVHRRDAQFTETGDVGPSVFRFRLGSDGGHEGRGSGMVQAGPRAGRSVSSDDVEAVEQFADMRLCLVRGLVRARSGS